MRNAGHDAYTIFSFEQELGRRMARGTPQPDMTLEQRIGRFLEGYVLVHRRLPEHVLVT